MHELFATVLSQKDLSKAGDLFSLDDSAIEEDLEEIVREIQVIADAEDYEHNDNDQSVVEISITRITTAIRETDKIEQHVGCLVELLNMCHRHNLTQVTKDEDPPHAKIASDVMSRLFTYYSNQKVMELAIPAVVRFLGCDNKDLSRSVASYLSLAAIESASLLAQHMPIILASVLKGNYLLGQVMPQIYSQNPEPVINHVDDLARVLGQCEATEKVCFIQLFNQVAKTNPESLEKHISQLLTYLSSSLLSPLVLMILVDLSASRPTLMVKHVPSVQTVLETQPTLMAQVAQIVGSVGTVGQKEAEESMGFLVSRLPSVDVTILPLVLQEIRGLGLNNKSLLNRHLDQINKLSTSGSSAVRLMVQQIKEDARNLSVSASPTRIDQSDSAIASKSECTTPAPDQDDEDFPPKEMKSVSSQTEGTVTIITVGNPPNAKHPSGTVSVKSTGLLTRDVASQHSLTKAARNSCVEQVHHTVLTQTEDSHQVSSHPNAGWSQHPHARDGVQLFCEKHLTKIKSFISKVNITIPLPTKCSIVNGKHKRYLRLHFDCAKQWDQCLYSSTSFLLKTRLPKGWLHLMFLATQAKSQVALSQHDSELSCLKACWDALKGEASSSFLALVTSSFPTDKDQMALLHELHQMRYFDVFEYNTNIDKWVCFVCNHPEKISELLNDGSPEMAGQLKEKKGRWKFFKRWKTRYFTLSGGSFTYDKSNSTKASLPVTKIQSVKAIRKGIRDIPKAFEIFTDDQTYVFKAKGHQDAEQWIQCLHIAVARSHSTPGSHPSALDSSLLLRDKTVMPIGAACNSSINNSGNNNGNWVQVSRGARGRLSVRSERSAIRPSLNMPSATPALSTSSSSSSSTTFHQNRSSLPIAVSPNNTTTKSSSDSSWHPPFQGRAVSTDKRGTNTKL